MKNHTFITHGVLGIKVPTNPLLLSTALAETGNTVLFVEYSHWDKARFFQPWLWNKTTLTEVKPNFYHLLLTPPMPKRFKSMVNNWAANRVRQAIKQLGLNIDESILLLYGPTGKHLTEWLPNNKFIYRVIDDYSAMPLHAGDTEGTRAADETFSRSALAVYPSNPKLFEQKSALNKNTCYIPNAVNFRHFTEDIGKVPDDLANLPKPVLGFAGALDRYKVDFDLIQKVAQAKPEWSIALLGDIGACDETSKETLPKEPNIHYLGFRSYEDLPTCLSAFDVGIIPYVQNQYTEGVFPLKLYEYFALGLPVVSTDLPYLKNLEHCVYKSNGAEDFVLKTEQALKEDKTIKKPDLIELARLNSWVERAKALTEHLKSVL